VKSSVFTQGVRIIAGSHIGFNQCDWWLLLLLLLDLVLFKGTFLLVFLYLLMYVAWLTENIFTLDIPFWWRYRNCGDNSHHTAIILMPCVCSSQWDVPFKNSMYSFWRLLVIMCFWIIYLRIYSRFKVFNQIYHILLYILIKQYSSSHDMFQHITPSSGIVYTIVNIAVCLFENKINKMYKNLNNEKFC
jgi:hypothetical protein